MPTVLHVLPHRGGGAETYIDALGAMEGFTHERVTLSTGPSARAAALSLPVRWSQVARRAREADVVHAHGDVAAMLSLPVLKRRPAVWTTHGLHLLRRMTGARRARVEHSVRAVVAATAATICTSRAEYDELHGLVGADGATLLLHVPNGIELPSPADGSARAAVRAELDLGDDDIAVLFLGELAERKAPLDAVAAVDDARADGHPLVLLVAGDGPQAAVVRAAEGPGIRALGHRTDPERLLAAADVFVAPSAREGLSFAVLEAMGHGLAVVVSDGAGNPEAVGEAGLVFPAGDRDALTAALVRLAQDPAERRRLGAAARERVREQFPASRLRAGVAEAYRRAAQGA